jgi:hypothetical protein
MCSLVHYVAVIFVSDFLLIQSYIGEAPHVLSGTLASKKSKKIPKRHSRTRQIKRTEITEAKGKKVDKRQTQINTVTTLNTKKTLNSSIYS